MTSTEAEETTQTPKTETTPTTTIASVKVNPRSLRSANVHSSLDATIISPCRHDHSPRSAHADWTGCLTELAACCDANFARGIFSRSRRRCLRRRDCRNTRPTRMGSTIPHDLTTPPQAVGSVGHCIQLGRRPPNRPPRTATTKGKCGLATRTPGRVMTDSLGTVRTFPLSVQREVCS